MPEVTGFEVVSDQRLGEGGFLRLRRTFLRNLHADGTRSREYLCDFVERPRGLDAVALVIWTRAGGSRPRVLIRACLRPPIQLGRPGHAVPLPARPDRPLLNAEVVAGLCEPGDEGEPGIRKRAAQEAHEETGFQVSPDDVVLLGAPSMPVPGLLPEYHFYAAVEIADPGAAGDHPGDGSPMEEGAAMFWLDLETAIARCVAGEIEDTKTEVALRRLRDRL
ncbi:MAG TPA: NUDIX hydrolase [Polyangia bacterium]|nr:NUDIX hydrolase [Polyangia bacterium]